MKYLYSPLLIFFFLVFSSFEQPDAKTYYENGLNSLNQKDYIQAISEFTNAISLNPNFADAYYHRATAKELLGIKMGFFSSELCSDLISAMMLGKTEAIGKLELTCMNECYDLDGAFVEPEVVYCADFSSKVLADFPAGYDKLNSLVKLNMYNNKFTLLSDKFTKLSRLVQLDISSNKITNIDPSIGKLSNLTELNLSKNQITTLPYEFGNLKKMRLLNMRQNGITTFPRSIASLSNLEVLDLAINKLTTLPLEVTQLKKLKKLILVGNEISASEQKKIKALLPHTEVIFQ